MSKGLGDGLSAALSNLDTAVESLQAAKWYLGDAHATNWADRADAASAIANELAVKVAAAADALGGA
jgi:hypothetical protein